MKLPPERQCLNLEVIKGRPAIRTIPAVPGVKSSAICHCTDESQCGKKKNTLEISALCFRIRDRHQRDAKGKVKK